MKLLLVPVLLAAVGQAGQDPEKIYKALEEKINKADNVHVGFDGKIDGRVEKGTVKGTLDVAKGNKARMHLDLNFLGKDMKITGVSDGAKMSSAQDGKATVKDTPKGFTKMVTGMITKVGVSAGMMFGITTSGPNDKEDQDPFAKITVSNFKLGKEEKINGKDALAIEFKIDPGKEGPPGGIACTLWLDAKTMLPVRRVLTADKGGEKMSITEDYTAFTINGKIDAKLFDLP